MAAELRSSNQELAAALVAVLFVRAEPLPVAELCSTLELSPEELELILVAGASLLLGTGLMLQRHLDQVQLVSHPLVSWAVERALRPEVAGRLSRPALETLAIVAYRQPITRSGIEAIRGVGCEAVLESLSRHELITELGRAEGPGRARLFGTTLRFLQVVGIARIEELPPLSETSQQSWLERAAGGAAADAD